MASVSICLTDKAEPQETKAVILPEFLSAVQLGTSSPTLAEPSSPLLLEEKRIRMEI
jgi:hypothetical protein